MILVDIQYCGYFYASQKINKFHKIYLPGILRQIFTVYILYITENCSTTQLCEYFISIRNMEARKAHLCHWNETEVVIRSHVSSSCLSASPSASPVISYQWVLILNHQSNTIQCLDAFWYSQTWLKIIMCNKFSSKNTNLILASN